MEDKDASKDDMERRIGDIDKKKENDDFDGTIKKSGSGDFEKVIIDSEYTRDIHMIHTRSWFAVMI